VISDLLRQIKTQDVTRLKLDMHSCGEHHEEL